jgi:hypothetical protein
MGGFLSNLGTFINKVGPTTASLVGEFTGGGGVNYTVPPAQAQPAPAPANQQGGGSVIGEVLIVAVVAVAALLIYREMSKKR